MRIHPLITKSEDLRALVERLSAQPFVAVDTEFMRENTYWPDLCLIQVASGDEAAAIDPKAEGIDLKSLLDLFVNNEDVLKVFHAGGQDLEIIHNLSGKVPHPLFDTQIAAMALGHGEQIGYSNLIESLLGHSLDKGARFTDWSRRPLDKRQIDYAIADVTHLATVFPRMVEKLKKTGRGDVARRGDGASCRSFELRLSSGGCVEAPEAPKPQSRCARSLKSARWLARDGSALEEPPARPDYQG